MRAFHRIWSKTTYRLREVVSDPGNWVMYYLLDGPERAFMSEELMLIPEDTELPLDYVQNGNIYPTGINISASWLLLMLMVLISFSQPFDLSMLLFSRRHSFLRFSYMGKTFYWSGTNLFVHSNLYILVPV